MKIDALFAASAASPEFLADVVRYQRTGEAALVRADRRSPPLKVLRVIAQLLEQEADLRIESVTVHGRSGCSDFAGTVDVHAGGSVTTFRFVWDCRWRAEQDGWYDCFGFPDQMRAAREYGWRCFRVWNHEREVASVELLDSVTGGRLATI